jgi:hypothetical protein
LNGDNEYYGVKVIFIVATVGKRVHVVRCQILVAKNIKNMRPQAHLP